MKGPARVPLASLYAPLHTLRGILKDRLGHSLFILHRSRHAGQIVQPYVPPPDAPTQTEINLMNVHVLDGPLHTTSNKTPGTFLKATSPTTFAFEPHGLTAADVAALPLAGTAADSDKLDGYHASHFLAVDAQAADSAQLQGHAASYFLAASAQAADSALLGGHDASYFEPAIAQGSGDKYFAADKTWKFLDHLCASDGSPAPALSVDAGGQVGIGTAAPAATLDVAGGIRSQANVVIGISGAADRALTLFSDTEDRTAFITSHGNYSEFGSTGGQVTVLKAAGATGHVEFQAGDAERARIKADGTFGIGTTNPGRTLDVNGEIRTNSNLTFGASGTLFQGATTRIDTCGNIAAAGLTANSFPACRFRGIGSTLPTTDLVAGDLFMKSDAGRMYLYYGSGWRYWDYSVP